jgi:hypothetical protein
MKAAIVCLTALAVGCGRPDPRVAVGEDFDAGEQAIIERAAAKWNSVVRKPIDVSGFYATWRLIKDYTPEMQDKQFVGLTTYGTRTIRIKPGLSESSFYSTVLHELGHAQGLHHIAGPGVMNPNVGATEFTPGDIEECQAEGVCGYSPVEAAKLRLQGVID